MSADKKVDVIASAAQTAKYVSIYFLFERLVNMFFRKGLEYERKLPDRAFEMFKLGRYKPEKRDWLLQTKN